MVFDAYVVFFEFLCLGIGRGFVRSFKSIESLGPIGLGVCGRVDPPQHTNR